MEKRMLGASGMQVSLLGLGCWPLGGGPGWGDQDECDSIATIHAALDLGITLLDTAEGYNEGESERVVGVAIADRRERAIVATKLSPNNARPDLLRAHCEASLRRLQTDYVDLYQVHWPIEPSLVDDAFATLSDLQAEGKIRHIGVSNHGVQQLGQVIATGIPIASNQLCYSLIARAIEYEIEPLCAQNQLGIIGYMAMMQGLLIGKYATIDDVPPFRARTRHFSSSRPEVRHGQGGYEQETFAAIDQIRQIAHDAALPMAQLALSWVAAQPSVSCVLAGSRDVKQIEENVQWVSRPLPADLLAALDKATEPLKQVMGPNPDMWQGSETSRIH